MAGLTLTLVCVATASGYTVGGVSERRPTINEGPHQIQSIKPSIKEWWDLVLRFFMFLSVYTRFSLEVEWEAWEGRLLVGNLKTTKLVYWINVYCEFWC